MDPYQIVIDKNNKISVRQKTASTGEERELNNPDLLLKFLNFLIGLLKEKKIEPRDFKRLGNLLWNFTNIETSAEAVSIIREIAKKDPNAPKEQLAFVIPNSKETTQYFNFPWELLSYIDENNTNKDKLSSLQEISYFYRRIDKTEGEVLIDLSQDKIIRILMVVSAQTKRDDSASGGENLDPIDVDKLRDAFKKLSSNEGDLKFDCRFMINQQISILPEYEIGKIKVTSGNNQDADNSEKQEYFFEIKRFKEYLKNFQPHIVHFVSHGELEEKKLMIAMNTKQTELHIEKVPADTFLECFNDLNKLSLPKVVFMQVCNMALIPGGGEEMDVAASLSFKGIPAVIAMQLYVHVEASTEFAIKFYEKVFKQDNPSTILSAFYESIKDLDASYGEKLRNALPVLYLAKDGTLISPPILKPGGTQNVKDDPNKGDQDNSKGNKDTVILSGTPKSSIREDSRFTMLQSKIKYYEKDNDSEALIADIWPFIENEIKSEYTRYKKSILLYQKDPVPRKQRTLTEFKVDIQGRFLDLIENCGCPDDPKEIIRKKILDFIYNIEKV